MNTKVLTFCPDCGTEKAAQPKMHKCPVCGQIHKKGAYCVITGENIAKFIKKQRLETKQKLQEEFERINKKNLQTVRWSRKIIGFATGYLSSVCSITILLIVVTCVDEGTFNPIEAITALEFTESIIGPDKKLNLRLTGGLILFFSLLPGFFASSILGKCAGKKEKILWQSFLKNTK